MVLARLIKSAVCALVVMAPAMAQTQAQPTASSQTPTEVHTKASADTASMVVEFKPADGNLTTILKAEYAKAIKMGKLPVVEFYATWCWPCQRLAKFRGDSVMIDAFKNVYLIRLDFDAWKKNLIPTGFTPTSVPIFLPFDATGHPTGATITSLEWSDETAADIAVPLKKFFTEQQAKSATPPHA